MNDMGGDKFLRFMFFAALVAGGVWVFQKYDKAKTWLVANRGPKPRVPYKNAKFIGDQIGINWPTARFSVDEFARGMIVEMEHGKINLSTNVTNDDVLLTGKIAWAHLNELPDYYTRLDQMEEAAARYWGSED